MLGSEGERVLADFFYSHPTWVVAIVVIGVWTGLSLAGLFAYNKLTDSHARSKDTETVGLTYAIVAVVYAVLIAFIVVDVFEAAAKANEIATAEANQLSALMLTSTGLPKAQGDEIRTELREYINIVVKKEWPAQQAGRANDETYEPGWTALGTIGKTLASYGPATSGQNVNKGEMLADSNALMTARRQRIIAAADHLPDVVWQILILAGIVAVVYTYLFGAHSFRIHLAITGLIATTISLVFVLIIALDYPFRGDVSVGDDAFTSVQASTFSAPPTASKEPAK
jgi:protein-S-isoprenylcysteine O-methyltransferase Ste14